MIRKYGWFVGHDFTYTTYFADTLHPTVNASRVAIWRNGCLCYTSSREPLIDQGENYG